VDNHSSDSTSQIAHQYSMDRGLTNLEVIRNSQNLGYGGSQKVGYQRAIDLGLKYVAMVHADGQYAPEVLAALCEPIFLGQSDLVFGSRIQGSPIQGGMPIHRFLGNRCLTMIQNLLLKQDLSEFHSGYRVYSLTGLQRIPFQRLSADYHFDTEIIILMTHHGLRIQERRIPTYYGDEENHVNIWKYGVDVLITTGTYFLYRRGIWPSKNWDRILK